MCKRTVVMLCAVLVVCGNLWAEDAGKPFVIHEWGTFTVLQDEQGHGLPGVNINEEPLPQFTHRLYHGVVKETQSHTPLLRSRSKGIAANFAPATMRMETPIIYIYPPNDEPTSIDVAVRFQGGWISEWFPNAKVDAPGFDRRRKDLGMLSRTAQGSITWDDLTVNSHDRVPATDKHVWLAPRGVETPVLSTPQGQAEKYLFYRGVANIDAPLRVVRNEQADRLHVVRHRSLGAWEDTLEFNAMWLVDIDAKGAIAYHRVRLDEPRPADGVLATVPASFAKDDYDPDHLTQLRAEMKKALIVEGLYEPEAEAMLNTWELSYFKSSGLRLFFTLPRKWTDRVLPMDVSRDAEIERAMIGRIELITPHQRQLLDRLNGATITDATWFLKQYDALDSAKRATLWQALHNGSREVTDFEFDIPEDYATYMQLGRFRESLIADEARRPEAEGLRQFARSYGITLVH